MISTYSITFHKLMTAGYISAETYQFVLPKERLYELNVSEINSYKHKYRSELLPLFEDEDTYLTIAYMEKLETQLREGDLAPYELLIDCLCEFEFPVEIEHLVNDIGKKIFLQDYIYCTEDALKSKEFISNENIKTVISFRNKYRKLFQLNCGGLEIDECKSHVANTNLPAQADTIAENIIMSGEEFNSTDYVSIDEDAVSSSNLDCKKYVLFLYSLNKDQLYSIIDFLISLLSKISIRTGNGIKALGYREFLVNYLYAEPQKMLNIKNFGKKSLYDFEGVKPTLINFIKELYHNGNTESVEKTIKQEEEVIILKNRTLKERIGQDQYKLVNDLLAKLLKESTVRSRNGIQAYKGDFLEDFVNRSNNIKNIKNIGKKSESEIILIIDKLREFIATLEECEISPEDLFWMKKKENYDILLDEFCRNYYSSNQVIPMLHVLENCFNEMIKIRDFGILNEIIPFNGRASKTFDQVGMLYKRTPERVRQICEKSLSRISNFYSKDEKESVPFYHETLSNNEDWNYLLEQLLTKPIWNIFDFEPFALRENCSLSVETISLAFSVVFRDSYELIGKRPLSITSSNNDWSNTFLVCKSLTEKFDFEQMLHDIDKYQESSTEPLTKNAQELLDDPHLIGSWRDYDPTLITDLGNAVSTILIEERGLIPDANLKFTIEGKMKEKAADVIYRILSHKNEPIDLEDLLNLLNSENVEEIKSRRRLNAIISHDSRICKVNYANKVALVEWGIIVIGNIREMIVDFLNQFEEPQHFDVIANYIQSYRPDTKKESIRTSLYNGDQFIQFDGGYYGLNGKTYPEWYYLPGTERAARQRLTEFENFIKSNRRFPFSTSDDHAEEQLYYWWLRLNRKNNNSDFIVNEINRIVHTYQDFPQNRTDYEWFKKCNEYERFFSENRRKPGKANSYEKELAVWLERALDDFSQNCLSPNKEQAFVRLTKLF